MQKEPYTVFIFFIFIAIVIHKTKNFMKAKDLFARILSNEDMQAVVNCAHLPVIEVNEQECRQAYKALSATDRCVLRHRVSRYLGVFSGKKTEAAQSQVKMFSAIQKIIS